MYTNIEDIYSCYRLGLISKDSLLNNKIIEKKTFIVQGKLYSPKDVFDINDIKLEELITLHNMGNINRKELIKLYNDIKKNDISIYEYYLAAVQGIIPIEKALKKINKKLKEKNKLSIKDTLALSKLRIIDINRLLYKSKFLRKINSEDLTPSDLVFLSSSFILSNEEINDKVLVLKSNMIDKRIKK